MQPTCTGVGRAEKEREEVWGSLTSPLLGWHVQRPWGEGMLGVAGALQEMRSSREDLHWQDVDFTSGEGSPVRRGGLAKV